MKTVKEVSELTGISIRTLRYYDEISLLKPAKLTEAGYRLYDKKALEKLRQIMFFRELDISLSDIRKIMDNPKFDKREILETQKFLLEMKRNRLNGMIELISDVLKGEDKMNFEAFNNDDIQKIVNHSLEVMSEEDKKVIVEKYGDIDKFKENVVENLKDEKVGEHLIKIYGSKEKAVEASLQATGDREEFSEQQNEIDIIYKQFACAMENSNENIAMEAVAKLAENYKSLFRMDNARALLLDVAKDYLNNSQMEEATDRQYGMGITKYIGSAIYRYYGVEEMK
ncbi:MerR family transcriptional regulator [Diplocloster agilis]|uniref:MerR family transcriptional regulator n=1 Tax=Diplocloster agilis TaxID=2850323 RepID=UPI0008226FF2|nr:MerR family transcriptional regulator [Suonthocola fibrivorans]MCU6733855.1 MerR family transcriptional regulator [Suonthocola fibrivorans]SCJ12789.1 Multidrug transporter activation protein [uncultured Clostridium sp.]